MTEPEPDNIKTLDSFERKVGIITLAVLAVGLVASLVVFNGFNITTNETIDTLAKVIVGVFVGAFGAKKLGS